MTDSPDEPKHEKAVYTKYKNNSFLIQKTIKWLPFCNWRWQKKVYERTYTKVLDFETIMYSKKRKRICTLNFDSMIIFYNEEKIYECTIKSEFYDLYGRPFFSLWRQRQCYRRIIGDVLCSEGNALKVSVVAYKQQEERWQLPWQQALRDGSRSSLFIAVENHVDHSNIDPLDEHKI